MPTRKGLCVWVFAWVLLGARRLRLRGEQNRRARAHRAGAVGAVAIPVGTEPIKIDGELAEEIWTKAPPITEFLQRDPTEGAKPTRETEARVVFDAEALYVAVRAHRARTGSKIVGHADAARRGLAVGLVRGAWSTRTATAARRTSSRVNAAGVKQDRYWFNDTNNDTSWDAVWDVAVVRSPQGWRAEFRIPFSQLRFKSGRELVVRLRDRPHGRARRTRRPRGRCSRAARAGTSRRSASSRGSRSRARRSGSS